MIWTNTKLFLWINKEIGDEKISEDFQVGAYHYCGSSSTVLFVFIFDSVGLSPA